MLVFCVLAGTPFVCIAIVTVDVVFVNVVLICSCNYMNNAVFFYRFRLFNFIFVSITCVLALQTLHAWKSCE